MSIEVTSTLAPYGAATAILLSEEELAALGGGVRAPVVVEVAGRSARMRVARMGGVLAIGISKANRAALNVEIGDTVTATISLDTAERTVEVPNALAHALAQQPGARAAFDALSYTRRREHAESVDGAKHAATRDRRIARILTNL